jgi:hypothetical protein
MIAIFDVLDLVVMTPDVRWHVAKEIFFLKPVSPNILSRCLLYFQTYNMFGNEFCQIIIQKAPVNSFSQEVIIQAISVARALQLSDELIIEMCLKANTTVFHNTEFLVGCCDAGASEAVREVIYQEILKAGKVDSKELLIAAMKSRRSNVIVEKLITQVEVINQEMINIALAGNGYVPSVAIIQALIDTSSNEIEISHSQLNTAVRLGCPLALQKKLLRRIDPKNNTVVKVEDISLN